MALYIIQDFTTIVYTQTNVIAIYNEDTPNLYAQYKYTAATIQAPTTQDIAKIKTK